LSRCCHFERVREEILRKLDNIQRHEEPAKLASGWTKTKCGHWIPPGWSWSGDTGDEALDNHGPKGEA
jgi:hypothetical protein